MCKGKVRYRADRSRDERYLRLGMQGGKDSELDRFPPPNIGLQATANSLRSYLAAAIGGA